MKSLSEIVDFYNNLETQDLFTDSYFSLEEFHKIDVAITKKNKEFFDYLEKQLELNKFSNQSLQITFNKLSDIYENISYKLESYHISNIENTPVFRFKIVYNGSLLTKAFSIIAIIKGISEIYWYLERHFQDEIKIGEPIYSSSYIPPYTDENSYIQYIYIKFLKDNFLAEELYNQKHFWTKKIDEFFQILPSDINISLPSDYLKVQNEINDNQISINKIIKDLENELRYLGVKTIDDGIKDIFEENNSCSGLVSGGQLIFSRLNDNLRPKQNKSTPDLEKNVVAPDGDKLEEYIKLNSFNKDKANEFLLNLFYGLKQLKMVSVDSDDKDIVSVFSGIRSESKIIWCGHVNSLAYFIKQLNNVYRLITIRGEKWSVICKYFKNNVLEKDFLPSSLHRGTSFKNTHEIDTLIKQFKNDLVSLEKFNNISKNK